MATSDILTIVQACPDIGTSNATYVNALIEAAKALAVVERALPYWPETDAAGYSVGASGGSTDLSGLSEATLLLTIDESAEEQVTGIALASCTTGAATATEVQRAIRAFLTSGAAGYRSFSNVAVAWDAGNTRYTITSPSFGEDSRVIVGASDDYFEVAQAMKLGRTYGGTEYIGVWRDADLERAVAALAIQAYRNYRMLPQVYKDVPDKAVQRAWAKLDDAAMRVIRGGRRWRFGS